MTLRSGSDWRMRRADDRYPVDLSALPYADGPHLAHLLATGTQPLVTIILIWRPLMIKFSALLATASVVLTIGTAQAAMNHPNPFIGMNPDANNGAGMCHLISAEGDTVYQGPGTVRVTINNNFAIGSCTVKPDTDSNVKPAFVERANVACHIKKPGQPGHFNGFGGFTVTPSGNVIARCQAELRAE